MRENPSILVSILIAIGLVSMAAGIIWLCIYNLVILAGVITTVALAGLVGIVHGIRTNSSLFQSEHED